MHCSICLRKGGEVERQGRRAVTRVQKLSQLAHMPTAPPPPRPLRAAGGFGQPWKDRCLGDPPKYYCDVYEGGREKEKVGGSCTGERLRGQGGLCLA